MKLTPKICYNCGKKMHTANQYIRRDKFLGTFSIPCKHEEYSFCDCGEERLAYSLCLRIEQEEQNRISQAIMNMAHNNLRDLEELVVTSRDLESIMNVSRQAISKNGKLKTLVYHITFKGKIFYLKKSVELFKKKGDGRFDLSPYASEITATTMDKSTMMDSKSVETSSFFVDSAPNPSNVLYQNAFREYSKYDPSFFQSKNLPMKQNAWQYGLNDSNTRMSNMNLLLIANEANHLLTKANQINSHIINKGEKNE